MDDSHCHNEIGFDQLVFFFAQSHKDSDPIADARRILRHLDKDDSDTIKKAELHMVIKRIENEMSGTELILRRLEHLGTKMERMDSKMERIKSEVQTTMDVRIHERIRLELGALIDCGGGGGGSIAPGTANEPTTVSTKTGRTPDPSLPQKSLYSRRRDVTDIRLEIAESMAVPFKKSSPADIQCGTASWNQSDAGVGQMNGLRAFFRY